MNKVNKNKGFTLIEILVVIGIIAILATIVIIAINPARQFKQAHDTQRVSNVNAILNAIGQYVADNKGSLPAAITTTATDVSKAGIDICTNLVPTYIASLPFDPTTGNYTDCGTYDTGYKVSKDATTGRVTVTAAGELTNPISVTR